ncbi:MAG TPA: serine hydrolase [Rhizomicrobium sp.]|nr:serine hydrolase [Rhizomicrobium sp.]
MISRRHFSAALLAGMALPPSGAALGQTVDGIRRAARGLNQMHALMVQRGDEVIVAEAPRGPGLDRAANIKSCSKSIVALLLGTTIARGEIKSVNARLGDVAPKLIPAKATPGVAAITLEDLVTLRGGLESTSGANYGSWVQSPNWVAHALRRPMLDVPGGRMIYSTGSTHILGAVLATATGKSLLALARERLGKPLGIEIPGWRRDPQGFYFGGNEMTLTPRGMLKLAALVRDRGRVAGTQVIAQNWIDASLIRRTQSPFSGLYYGYGWFLSESGFAIARGYGGQIIAAHPQRKLAVAITSDPNQPARSAGYFGDLMALLEGPVLALG